MNIYNIFIDRLGQPENNTKLLEYIDFISKKTVEESNNYCEYHHILPRSTFPEFSKSDWNISKLEYDDHVTAHIILAEAYPIRQFIHPLNYMLNIDEKEIVSKMLSETNKKWWDELKKDDKRYSSWRKKRSEAQKKYMMKNPDHNKKYQNYDENRRNAISDRVKEMWNDEDKREKIIDSMKKYHSQEHVKKEFKEKIDKWKKNLSEDEQEKIKKRKQEQVKIMTEKAAVVNKKNWNDPVWRANMLEKRKGYRWWTNGTVQKKSKECPGDDFYIGKLPPSEETRKKMSQSHKNRRNKK